MPKLKSRALVVYGGQGADGFDVSDQKAARPAPPPKSRKAKAVQQVSGVVGTASEYARLLADPLNAPLVGRPDSSTAATNVCRIRDVIDVTSTSAGHAAFSLAPNTSFASNRPVLTGASAEWVTGATYGISQYHNQLVSDNNLVRTLVYVVEWVPTGSLNNMKGRVFMGQYQGIAIDAMPAGDITTLFDDDGCVAAATMSATTIVRPTFDTHFHLPTVAQFQWIPTVYFVATGLPQGEVVGQLIVTRVIEQVPKGQVLARHQAGHTICDPMACCQASNIQGRKVTYAVGANATRDIIAAGMKLLPVLARVFKAVSTGGQSEMLRLLG